MNESKEIHSPNSHLKNNNYVAKVLMYYNLLLNKQTNQKSRFNRKSMFTANQKVTEKLTHKSD